MTKAIEVNQLSKSYRRGKVRALDQVSLSVARGEVLGIIGPDGAGKTTPMGSNIFKYHYFF
jgi:ABC-2 type transport system ATP-binding protein